MSGGAKMELPEVGEKFLVRQASGLLDGLMEYREMMMAYSCAIKEVKTKFDVLDTEFHIRNKRNPISTIHTRLKSQTSILEKMHRIGCPPTLENIEEQLNDIAGVRVICSYVDDIYEIADALIRQDDIHLLRKKDYIAHPKPNGYRSLHLIVSVPVFFAECKKDMKVEVQIRTIAMDFWASLEHQIKYKKDISNSDEIIGRLKNCADVIAETDLEMQKIRQEMEKAQDSREDVETIFEKLKKFDVPIV
ncbi:MAG TPA: GTP pyrophosphokinase family protein [Candidatus Mediterraneibacter vanvlietii]|nr:GTP pyrophosphokinase family protein [Candidatus Mediterraneibacter vanvlietii]